MTSFPKYHLKAYLLVSTILCLGYFYFEISIRVQDNHLREIEPMMEESLDRAVSLFNQFHDEFLDRTTRLYNEAELHIENGQNRDYIHSQISQYDFWGISIYKNNSRWLWDGFNLSQPPFSLSSDENENEVSTSILKRNNVVYLFGQTTFTIDDDNYDLLTAQKLEQSTNLPFNEGVEFSLSNLPELQQRYPVTFNFFNPLPENVPFRTFSTSSSDSAGTVYADPDDAENFRRIYTENISHWRGLFYFGFFLILFAGIFLVSAYKRGLLYFVIQSAAILTLWIAVFQFGLVSYWVELYLSWSGDSSGQTVLQLASYLLNALFLLQLFFICYNFFREYVVSQKNEHHFKTLFLALLYGGIAVILLLFFVFSTQTVLVDTSISLLDLELAPDKHTFLFYISAGLFFTAISGIIITIGHFLFVSEQDKASLIVVPSLFSFITIYYLADVALSLQLFVGWSFMLCLILFSLFLLMIHSIQKYRTHFHTMSGFRKLMLGVFIASSSLYVIIWSSTQSRLDSNLLERAVTFANEETTDSREILLHLLADLEQNLLFLSQEDIEQRVGIVQNQFQRAIQSSIRSDWRNHSFDIQLLRPDGEIIDDYSTNLNAPGWASLVNINLMSRAYRGERIRRETNRPVIWDRPTGLTESYVSFYRGWIPIYDEAQTSNIIAWIFGAVYVERPDYNKPIRAVLAAATSDDWKQSYYLAEFLGDKVTRTGMMGIYNNQPEYNRLPRREAEIAAQDSIAFITNITAQGTFREVLMNNGNRHIVKASTPIPGFNQHLFSYFRLHIVLVFFGLFLFSLFTISGFKAFSLFGQSRKFQHRLLDGLILATLLFLTVLIFATQYAVNNQNEKNIQRELIQKINNLDESIRRETDFQNGGLADLRLAEFTSPLNADAIFYIGPVASESTTPQIFQQNLMSRTMPFPAYNFLYERERRHYITEAELGGERLLIGYKALLNEENEPVGAIAIPTFLQSPVYREQLLETTSYLFGVYLAIFGLFILGSVFLSNRLTKPLQLIQNGLNKISRGDLKTQVEVTSQDEIGSLAQAYNEMVSRLDEARRELVRAEREAAWKEMAQQVAHEIKNPLTPMKLNLQHLQRQLESNPKRVMDLKPVIEKTAANIIEQIESLNKIASDFSKFAKPVSQPSETVDLSSLLSSVTELYQHDQAVTISLYKPGQPVAVEGVPDELRRVFINIVKNGIEASPNGHAEIDISLNNPGSHALIEIHDRGQGITAEDAERIFVPNFSTKSSGTGLGLAITKKIIEAHHGDIRFESTPGHGTSFFIKLPLSNHR